MTRTTLLIKPNGRLMVETEEMNEESVIKGQKLSQEVFSSSGLRAIFLTPEYFLL